MATHDYVIDNSTGANVRSDINNVLQAILTNNSSSSAPSTTAAYMWWADTTTGILKIRNSSDDGWVELLQLDGTLTLEDGSASTPGLAFRDDLNTGIFSSAADTFNVATGGVERMELGATTIFNESGADVDFRIEGDTEANLFYVDAGNDRIGIGTSGPQNHLHIHEGSSGSSVIQITNTTTGSSSTDGFQFGVNSSEQAFFHMRESAPILFSIGGSELMRIDTNGSLMVGGTSTVGANYRLQAFHPTDCRMSLANTTAASSQEVNLQFLPANSVTGAKITCTSEEDFSTTANRTANLAFFTRKDGTLAERMRIDSSGRLLVGASSTNQNISKIVVKASSPSDTFDNHVYLEGSETSGAARTGGVLAFGGHDGASSQRNWANVVGLKENSTTGNTAAFIGFEVRSAGGNPTEAARIASDGTVQIAASGAIAGFASSHINSGAPLKIYKSSGSTHAGLHLIWDHFNTSTGIKQKIQFTIGDDASSDGFNNAGYIGIEKINSWQSSANRDSSMVFATTAAATEAEGMRLDNNGRLIIGRTSSAAADTQLKLQVFAPSNGAMMVGQTNTSATGTATLGFAPSNSVTGAQIICTAEEDFSTSANRTARLEFKTRQDGTLTTVMTLSANTAFGAIGIYNQTTSSGANVNVASDGHVRRSTSSRKYKNTITDATHGLTELLKLKSVTFKGNDDGDTVFGGLIAEDVHDAGLTEFVQYDKDNEPDALAYGNMVALCVKAIQELTARVATLESA